MIKTEFKGGGWIEMESRRGLISVAIGYLDEGFLSNVLVTPAEANDLIISLAFQVVKAKEQLREVIPGN